MITRTPRPLRQLLTGARTLLVLTVLVGLAYPLAMTGAAQLLVHDNANGSMVAAHGTTVGSDLIGQAFTRPLTKNGRPVKDASGAPVLVPDPGYFQSRPSAAGAGYDPLATAASNLSLDNPELVGLVRQRRAEAAALDRIRPGTVAPDALLASGSGLDPHISPAYADQQVSRVAAARRVPEQQVRKLVDEHTQGRSLGFLGEPRVNVLQLNLALDSLRRSHAAD